MMDFDSPTRRILFCLAILAVAGCGSTGEIESSKPAWDRTTQLEIPPDLSSPKTSPGSEQFSAAARDASQAEQNQYAQFQKFQQMAEFQDFLDWREKYSASLDLSVEAFRRARDEDLAEALIKEGVLTITTLEGQRVLLVNDTLEGSWKRLDEAATNMGLQVISRREDKGILRVHYGTETPKESSGWTEWLPWLSDPIIYAVTIELARSGPAIIVRDDDGNPINTELANSFIDRLGIQLRTFASEGMSNTVENAPNPSKAKLAKMASGHYSLIIQGSAGGVWNQLDRTLRDTEFSVVERSKEQLSFLIRYDDPERLAEKSLVDTLAFWRDDKSAPAEDVMLVLTPTGEETRVDALDSSQEQSDVGDQVLTLLQKILAGG